MTWSQSVLHRDGCYFQFPVVRGWVGACVRNYRKHDYRVGFFFLSFLMPLFFKRCLAFFSFAPLRSKLQLRLILKGSHYPQPRGQRLSSRPHMRRLVFSSVKRVFITLGSGIAFLTKQPGRGSFLTGSDRFQPTSPSTPAIPPHRRSYFNCFLRGRQGEELFRVFWGPWEQEEGMSRQVLSGANISSCPPSKYCWIHTPFQSNDEKRTGTGALGIDPKDTPLTPGPWGIPQQNWCWDAVHDRRCRKLRDMEVHSCNPVTF